MKLPINYDKASANTRRLVREEYIKLQCGKCQHCNNSLDIPAIRTQSINKKLFPVNFFKYPVHLHHDHNTGLTIGAVHNYCNAVLWQYHGE